MTTDTPQSNQPTPTPAATPAQATPAQATPATTAPSAPANPGPATPKATAPAQPAAPKAAPATAAPAPRPQAPHQPSKLQDGDFKPKMTVVGVGGAGCNAVNNMIRSQLEGVDFCVMNTDAQALQQSLTDRRIHLGDEITQGLGAGSSPDVGRAAAEESHDQVVKEIRGSNMVFIAAGMGGGTGTGSAPVIAQMARDLGVLTVGVVTKPFNFEGAHRMRTAEKGIEELQKAVDTLIVIPNQNLFRIANENTTFADAFKMADDVLYAGVRSVTDLMIMPGLINLDFADVRTVMSNGGKAMMGTGEADGEGRAIAAAEAAIANPLLDDVSMRGAEGVLISITGGMDMTLFEVDEAANRIREEVEVDANIIFGSTFDDRLSGRVRVSVVATGIEAQAMRQAAAKPQTTAASQPEAQQSQPQQDEGRPVLNLSADEPEDEYEVEEASIETSSSDNDDFMDATDESHDSQKPNIFDEDESHEDEDDSHEDHDHGDTHSSSHEEGEDDTQQMEIQFGAPSSPTQQPANKKQGNFSAGNFLSRFLRGRNKAEQAPQHKEAPTFAAPDISSAPKNDNPNDQFDDELDVPTFMRKQGGDK